MARKSQRSRILTRSQTANSGRARSLLHRIPQEIKEMIYKESLHWEPKNLATKPQTPALIEALRPDQELYFEALAYFGKHNTFQIHTKNLESRRLMLPTALQNVTSLVVVFPLSDISIKADKITSTLLRARDKNLTCLEKLVYLCCKNVRCDEYKQGLEEFYTIVQARTMIRRGKTPNNIRFLQATFCEVEPKYSEILAEMKVISEALGVACTNEAHPRGNTFTWKKEKSEGPLTWET